MSLSVRFTHAFPDLRLDVAFEAPDGLTALVGPSGAGKTSVVQTVAGLMQPDSGRVAVDDWVLLNTETGQALPPHRRELGYIFQEGRLFPHLTVRQNLGYSQQVRCRGRVDHKELHRIADLLGITTLLDRRPGNLSGGEKQRVGIGRALLAKPRILLADEPLAALDEARKAEILPYFERLRDEVSVPILYVSHVPAEVARLATSVVVMDQGRVVRQGPAQDVLSDPMVTPSGARGAGAVVSAQVQHHHPDGITELSAGGVPLFLPKVSATVGQTLRVRVGAQEVILSRDRPQGLSALNIIPGTVETIRTGEGPGMLVSLATPAGPLLARVTRRSATELDLRPGTQCHAIIKSVAIAPQDVGRAPNSLSDLP
ncbi:MAG: molybdenum ABC transporter ATP-binding protein [Pseudomonadota bacterium]